MLGKEKEEIPMSGSNNNLKQGFETGNKQCLKRFGYESYRTGKEKKRKTADTVCTFDKSTKHQ